MAYGVVLRRDVVCCEESMLDISNRVFSQVERLITSD